MVKPKVWCVCMCVCVGGGGTRVGEVLTSVACHQQTSDGSCCCQQLAAAAAGRQQYASRQRWQEPAAAAAALWCVHLYIMLCVDTGIGSMHGPHTPSCSGLLGVLVYTESSHSQWTKHYHLVKLQQLQAIVDWSCPVAFCVHVHSSLWSRLIPRAASTFCGASVLAVVC
jgi:hypothetical protein